MIKSEIVKIITARNTVFEKGQLWEIGTITEIEFIPGDYEIGSRSGYCVAFSDDSYVNIYDVVESWSKVVILPEAPLVEMEVGENNDIAF